MLQIFSKTNSMIFSFILLMLFSCSVGRAQNTNINIYKYLSPVPDAKLVMPSTGIIIRYKTTFSTLTSGNITGIIVTGAKSGLHKGKLLLLNDNNILSFKPFVPFDYGEKVTVELRNNDFKLTNGNYAPYLKYSFQITEKKINTAADPLISLKSGPSAKKSHNGSLRSNYILNQDSLPQDFPDITVNCNNPTKGSIFFSTFYFLNTTSSYLIISDNYGIPVFYKKMGGITIDFKKQPNGNLSFYYTPNHCFYIMNASYEIIDSLRMQYGYTTNSHELRILNDGHILLMAYDPEPVRMDTIVAGGDPDAVVTGLVLQELDENKNLIFQWRSWDHFQITDATYDIDLTDSLIDYVHANAIEIDQDGNILLSCRHMDEITKINRTTGDIIWRWGGEYCENNQFTFINDPTGFSHQHHIRRLPNGNYTLFDNGNLHDPPYSRAVEYHMDEQYKNVTLIWQYSNDPLSYSGAMGSTQRLSNNNTFIGWGWNGGSLDISEVTAEGNQELSFRFPDTITSYRAFKYDWDTEFFTSDKDTLQFGVIPVAGSASISFNLTNNSAQPVEINSVYNRNSAFVLQQQLPVAIPSQESVTFTVNFNPDTAGAYNDDVHLRWETEGQRIAKVIHLSGVTDSTYLGVDEEQIPENFLLSQNYPNPFNPVSKIKYSISHSSLVQLRVYDILGNEIATLVNKEQTAGSYEVEFNGSALASGIYFYRLNAGKFTSVKKMLLLK